MSTPRFGRIQRATALVPLALLSAAWTASAAGLGGTSIAAADSTTSRTQPLPDGTTVPTEAIEAPASVSAPRRVAPGIAGNKHHAIKNASTTGIPSAALSAYQRAETVINAADKSCKMPWQLVAAIGRVESDHGRVNGNHLNAKGIAQPGIFGIPLDGSHHTQAIRDTDAGQYDADAKWDRAVGPMQFIPSTWSVVGVDADGDGQRNPQDVNDAALATAVYMCSGADDLSTAQGQRAAVYRYNHSKSYVDLVLSIMNAYMKGDFTSVPSSTSGGGYFVPDPNPPAPPKGHHPHAPVHHGAPTNTAPAPQPQTPAPTPVAPSTPSNPTGGGGGDKGGNGGGVPNTPLPTKLPSLPTPTIPPVDDTLTKAEALAQCTAQGVIDNPLTSVNELTQCVNNLLHG